MSDELGIHPDQKRWAVTYSGASAYVKRIIAHDVESEAKRLAFDEHLGQWKAELSAARTEAFDARRDEMMASRPRLLSYSGPGGSSGDPIGLPPAVKSEIRAESWAAADQAEAAFRKRRPEPVPEVWEKQVWNKRK